MRKLLIETLILHVVNHKRYKDYFIKVRREKEYRYMGQTLRNLLYITSQEIAVILISHL